jgi:adenosine deaminase CECR1
MMKGLFGYESAFRAYTQECIQSFIDDNIQWAEIRPNFPANILWTDDGKHKKTNREILEILREEAAKKVNSLEGEYFGGWKVIYCCPRSFSRKVIADALEECIQLYLAFPDMICGKCSN